GSRVGPRSAASARALSPRRCLSESARDRCHSRSLHPILSQSCWPAERRGRRSGKRSISTDAGACELSQSARAVALRPRLREARKLIKERLVVLQRIGRRFRLDFHFVPQVLIAKHFNVVFLAVEFGAHVEEKREETRRHLILGSPPERPSAGCIHVDSVNVGDEDLDPTPQRDV